MRKSLLLAAAAFTAGAIGASAQVYSANVVGYINLNLAEGYNVIANQLSSGDNTIGTILGTGIPDGTTLAIWDFDAQSFGPPITYLDGVGWLDDQGEESDLSLAPENGAGYLINVPEAVTITLVGDVPQGNFSTDVRGPGYDLIASVPPVAAGLMTTGFPEVDGMVYTEFAGGTWLGESPYPLTFLDGVGWLDADGAEVDPTPAVGAGFLVNNPGDTTSWDRSFTVE